MPRTSDDRPLKVALTERTALMQAGIINGVEFSRHIGQRNGLSANLQFLNRARCNLRDLRRANERHSLFQSPSSGTCALSTFASNSTNFCLRSDWSRPPSASASCVIFIEQNFGPHIEQNFASL